VGLLVLAVRRTEVRSTFYGAPLASAYTQTEPPRGHCLLLRAQGGSSAARSAGVADAGRARARSILTSPWGGLTGDTESSARRKIAGVPATNRARAGYHFLRVCSRVRLSVFRAARGWVVLVSVTPKGTPTETPCDPDSSF